MSVRMVLKSVSYSCTNLQHLQTMSLILEKGLNITIKFDIFTIKWLISFWSSVNKFTLLVTDGMSLYECFGTWGSVKVQ